MKNILSTLLIISAFIVQQFAFGQPTWQKVQCGTEFSLALKSDSTLWSWGNNGNGQLGVGNTDTEFVPVQVGIDTDWVDISAGAFHALGLKSDGTLWAWGFNANGQLGTGDLEQRLAPTQVGTDTDWAAVFAGQAHSLAIKADGAMWAWGFNMFGQLGIGNTNDQNTPVLVESDGPWLTVSGGGGGHTLAIAADSTLWAFGYNGTGQLGEGVDMQSAIPIQVGVDSDWVEVSAGFEFSLGRKSDGSIWSWGFNGNGQLGNGTTEISEAPVQIGEGESWSRIVAAASYAFAIRSDQSLFGWGFNGAGQLGTGDTAQENEPIQVGDESTWIYIAGATGGSSGGQVVGTHSLGIKEPATVVCASGSNYIGQTGNEGGAQILGFDCSTGDLTVSIFDHEVSGEEMFTVFPNPAVAEVTINLLSEKGGEFNYRLTTVAGQHLVSGRETGNVFQLDLSDLKGGLYVLAIERNGLTQYKRIVVE